MKYALILLASTSLLLSACASTKSAVKTDLTEDTEPVKAAESKYETLVYGAEKPLVCTETFAAIGELTGRPNLQVMWENYLYDKPAGIWSEIGGLVEVNGNLPFDQGQWTNACTVRLSHMLNKAGHKIPRKAKKTVSGGNKDQYYYRVTDLEEYLNDAFGAPDVDVKDGNSFDLPAVPGIVLMDFPAASYTGHVTVWNGAGTVDGAEIGGYRVMFWKLPCFIPEDRESTPVAINTNTATTLASLP